MVTINFFGSDFQPGGLRGRRLGEEDETTEMPSSPPRLCLASALMLGQNTQPPSQLIVPSGDVMSPCHVEDMDEL